MKIYYASQSFYPHIGGVSTYLLNLAKEMVNRGNEVVEVHLRPSGEIHEDDIKGIEIHRVPRDPIDKDLMEGYSKFKEIVYKESHYNNDLFNKNQDEIPGYKEYNQINEFFGEQLNELLKDGGADIVHIHDFQLLFAYKYVPRGTPCILTWHIPFIENMSKKLAEFLIKHLKEYDKIVFSSEEYIEAAVKLGLPREKIKLIHPIANTEIFRKLEVNKEEIKEKYGIPKDSKVILCVQRVDPKSGHEQLIRAMPTVLEKEPNAKLVFVGGESLSNKLSKSRNQLKNDILKLIEDLKIKNSVIWTGTIEYHELPKLYNGVEVDALCSKNEGFGLAVTEGMACGLPVVGTKVGGIPIQVKHGENGFLVDVGDSDATADAIIKILSDENLREEMSKRSLEIVDENFKIERGIEKHLELYNEVAKIKNEFHKLKYLETSEFKALVTDLDRTITDVPPKRDFDPADYDKNLMKELKKLEMVKIIATGRSIKYVKKLCNHFKAWDCAVAENGAVVYFPETKKTITTNSFYMAKTKRIVKELNLSECTIGKVIVSISSKDEELVREKIGKYADHVEFIKNVDEIMILPRGVGKGDGVISALKSLNIDMDKVILVGDGENDVDMFLNPGFKVALANAVPKLKSLATHVTKNPSTKGMYELIEDLKEQDTSKD